MTRLAISQGEALNRANFAHFLTLKHEIESWECLAISTSWSLLEEATHLPLATSISSGKLESIRMNKRRCQARAIFLTSEVKFTAYYLEKQFADQFTSDSLKLKSLTRSFKRLTQLALVALQAEENPGNYGKLTRYEVQIEICAVLCPCANGFRSGAGVCPENGKIN